MPQEEETGPFEDLNQVRRKENKIEGHSEDNKSHGKTEEPGKETDAVEFH